MSAAIGKTGIDGTGGPQRTTDVDVVRQAPHPLVSKPSQFGVQRSVPLANPIPSQVFPPRSAPSHGSLISTLLQNSEPGGVVPQEFR
jgi:hypothetical protein